MNLHRKKPVQRESSDQVSQKQKRNSHWRRTSSLMLQMVFIALALVIAGPFAVTWDDFPVRLFGFPLGYFFVAHGTIIAIITLVFWFSVRQDKVDHESELGE